MAAEPKGSDLLPISDVRAELGNICRASVYKLVSRKDLAQPVQVLGRSFWLRRDVEACKTRKRGVRKRTPAA